MPLCSSNPARTSLETPRAKVTNHSIVDSTVQTQLVSHLPESYSRKMISSANDIDLPNVLDNAPITTVPTMEKGENVKLHSLPSDDICHPHDLNDANKILSIDNVAANPRTENAMDYHLDSSNVEDHAYNSSHTPTSAPDFGCCDYTVKELFCISLSTGITGDQSFNAQDTLPDSSLVFDPGGITPFEFNGQCPLLGRSLHSHCSPFRIY